MGGHTGGHTGGHMGRSHGEVTRVVTRGGHTERSHGWSHGEVTREVTREVTWDTGSLGEELPHGRAQAGTCGRTAPGSPGSLGEGRAGSCRASSSPVLPAVWGRRERSISQGECRLPCDAELKRTPWSASCTQIPAWSAAGARGRGSVTARRGGLSSPSLTTRSLPAPPRDLAARLRCLSEMM